MDTVSPAAAAAQEAALFQLIADSQTTNYLAAAAITLVMKIEYVWKSRLSLWSVLYTRYATLTLLDFKTHELSPFSVMFRPMSTSKVCNTRCQTLLMSEVVSSTMMIISVDCVLVLRVWILLGRAKMFPFIMIPLLLGRCCSVIYMYLLTVLQSKGRSYFVDVGRFLNGCYALEVPRVLTFYPIAPFLMSLLMFSMTVYKCGEHIRYLMRVRDKTEPMSMITLFLRDGVFLFLWLVVLPQRQLFPALNLIPFEHLHRIPAVLAARILLNIKDLAYHTESTDAGTAIEFTTVLSRSAPPSRGTRVPWYLRTGEVNDIESEEM
ncbi:hypothetical protein FB45DRAFT_886190 [Roridomyces roridus]|uniref:Uncharacterized protein n=1 Tax=Roridomyces roridus TaxID=1738132 RepID=A0AAD7CI49_9AGAR|nr:hypothetical protein FB45DRAFT_886190 [Roridomyces roridus]